MGSILDDEFVIQMDELPPFSWIRQTPNRFMNCVLGRKIDHLVVKAKGNAQIFAIMAQEVLGEDKIQVETFSSPSLGGENCIISYSGQLKAALTALEATGGKGIVMSSGGMVKTLARKKGWDYIPLPKGYSTPFLFPEIFGCLLSIFGKRVNFQDIEKFIEINCPSEMTEANEAKRLAVLLKKERLKVLYDEKSTGLAAMFTNLFLTYSGMDLVKENIVNISSNKNGIKEVADVISFSSKSEFNRKKLIGNFPYDCDSLDGYLRNVIIAQFASLYLGILESREIELLDREVE